jgi:hypothetical protein
VLTRTSNLASHARTYIHLKKKYSLMQQSCKCKYFVAAEKAPAIMIQIITNRGNSGVKKKITGQAHRRQAAREVGLLLMAVLSDLANHSGRDRAILCATRQQELHLLRFSTSCANCWQPKKLPRLIALLSCKNPDGRGCLHRIYQSSPCRYTSHCCGHAVLAASETLSFRATHGLLTSYPYKKSIEPLNDSEHDSASDKPCHSISIVGCQRTHPLIVGISQRIRHAVWAFETVGFQRRGATRKGPG